MSKLESLLSVIVLALSVIILLLLTNWPIQKLQTIQVVVGEYCISKGFSPPKTLITEKRKFKFLCEK